MKVIFSPERQEKSGQIGYGEEHQVVSHGCCTLGTAEKVLGMVSQQPASHGQKLGEAEGLIGFLTKGRLDRTSTTKDALVCALSSCLPDVVHAHANPYVEDQQFAIFTPGGYSFLRDEDIHTKFSNGQAELL